MESGYERGFVALVTKIAAMGDAHFDSTLASMEQAGCAPMKARAREFSTYGKRPY